MIRRNRGILAGVVITAVCHAAGAVSAQSPFGTAPQSTAAPKAAEGKPAVIERAPLILRESSQFQIPLHLESARIVHVAARTDGVVATVLAKLGERVQAQAEVVRLDSQEKQLELTKAQAALRAVQAERAGAAGAAAAVIDAKLDEAKAGVDLAALRQDYCSVRSPLTGVVTELKVTDGQFVKAGDPLMTIVDPAKLQVNVPVDAAAVTTGSQMEIKVEDQSISATVQAVLPLHERFEPLRDLFPSVGSAVLLIDNSVGKLRVGATTYSPMIPRQAVTEVPMAAIANSGDGQRKVQVIRDGIVRDILVQPLGQQGSEYLFVSGRFGAGDELVVKSSEPLLDGARVMLPDGSSDPKPASAGQPATPTRRPTGF